MNVVYVVDVTGSEEYSAGIFANYEAARNAVEKYANSHKFKEFEKDKWHNQPDIPEEYRDRIFISKVTLGEIWWFDEE